MLGDDLKAYVRQVVADATAGTHQFGEVKQVDPLEVCINGDDTATEMSLIVGGCQPAIGDLVTLGRYGTDWAVTNILYTDGIHPDTVRHVADSTTQSGTVTVDFSEAHSMFLNITGDTTWEFTWPTQANNEAIRVDLGFRVSGDYTHTWSDVDGWPTDSEPAFTVTDGSTQRFNLTIIRRNEFGTLRTVVVNVADYL